MSIRRAHAAACITLMALTVSPVSPAMAAPAGWENCPVDHFCVWEGADGTGRIIYYRHGSTNVRKQGFAGGAQSAWNRTGDTWCIYNYGSYWGRYAQVHADKRINESILSLKKC